jgi:hypothetical protein
MKGLLEGVGSVIASLGRSDQFVKTRLWPFVSGLRILGKLLLMHSCSRIPKKAAERDHFELA